MTKDADDGLPVATAERIGHLRKKHAHAIALAIREHHVTPKRLQEAIDIINAHYAMRYFEEGKHYYGPHNRARPTPHRTAPDADRERDRARVRGAWEDEPTPVYGPHGKRVR